MYVCKYRSSCNLQVTQMWLSPNHMEPSLCCIVCISLRPIRAIDWILYSVMTIKWTLWFCHCGCVTVVVCTFWWPKRKNGFNLSASLKTKTWRQEGWLRKKMVSSSFWAKSDSLCSLSRCYYWYMSRWWRSSLWCVLMPAAYLYCIALVLHISSAVSVYKSRACMYS